MVRKRIEIAAAATTLTACLLSGLNDAPRQAAAFSADDGPGAPMAREVAPGAEVEQAFRRQVRPILQKYCFACHSDIKAKGELRLDALDDDFSTGKTATAWRAVEKQLRAGAMPPRSRPQPSAEELRLLMTWIETRLTAVDKARQAAEGRALLRRLNRTEYGNTVRDLLAVQVDLRSFLPQDEEIEGFDNVGPALTISSVLMERYLDAADAALKAAIVHGPRPKTIHERWAQRDRTLVGKDPWPGLQTDDAVVLFTSAPGRLSQFRPSYPGRYRVRISARAYRNQGKPMVMHVSAWGSGKVSESYFAVTDKPTVVEWVPQLGPLNTLLIGPYGLGTAFIRREDLAAYPGPGLAIEWVEVEGPLLESWPPPSHQRLLGAVELRTAKPADAEQVLRAFIPRAFRRPVTEAQIRPYVALLRSRLAARYSVEEALRVALKAVLCSPNFLFLRETPGRLDDFALASRLSYFLWKSMPDEKLIDLAAKGQLHAPDELRRQVERMLDDPKAAALTEDFLGHWLDLRNIDATSPDAMLYPEYDEFLRYSMLRETRLFFEEILKNDWSVRCFVDSDFAMLNERLARHYGIADVEGPHFRKVKLPPGSHRGGVLAQAAVLKVTANGTVTSPVLRGVWVLKNILGQPMPPPPADVPAVEPDIRGATSIRDLLARHRKVEACASCHRKIDPPGFALENFDVIGGWRTNYRALAPKPRLDLKVNGRPVQYREGIAVDAGDVLPDGQRFQDVDQFKRLLLQDPEQIARCLAEKLLVYGTGSTIGAADRAAVAVIVRHCRSRDCGLRTLIHEIVQSPLFLNK